MPVAPVLRAMAFDDEPPSDDVPRSAAMSPCAIAERFYEEYGPLVYRRCHHLLRDRDAARDAAQDVFIKLLRDPVTLEEPHTAVPWAWRVATNHCLNLLRDARTRGEEPDTSELAHRTADPRASAFPDAQLARAVLIRFDAQTQAIAVGVLVEEMDHEEVAAMLGISRRTVRRKLDRFLERARKFLAHRHA